MRQARRVVFGTYVVGLLVALAFFATDTQDTDGLILVPLATVSATLLAAALGVGSMIGTVALARERPIRGQDILTVALGWLGAIALTVYAAALGWRGALVIPAVIYIVVPVFGLASFLQLRRQMRLAAVPDPPVATYFWLYVTYGGLLLVILTVAFWEWSGLASLGMGFLALCAPVLLGVLAWRLRHRTGVSAYHRRAWLLSRGYVLLAGLGIACWLVAALLLRRGAA